MSTKIAKVCQLGGNVPSLQFFTVFKFIILLKEIFQKTYFPKRFGLNKYKFTVMVLV